MVAGLGQAGTAGSTLRLAVRVLPTLSGKMPGLSGLPILQTLEVERNYSGMRLLDWKLSTLAWKPLVPKDQGVQNGSCRLCERKNQ